MQFSSRNNSSNRGMNMNTFIRPNALNLNNYKSTIITVPPPKEDSKTEHAGKMKWGAPIWYLFHTLAEKVKEETFPIIRKELLDIIFTICVNLPCPDCANHATRFMQGINFDTILTKSDLKELLFRFHNAVNIKKGFPLFERAELDELYARANTTNIIKNFFLVYQSPAPKVTVNSFYKSRSISNIKSWIIQNCVQYFDP